MTARTDGAAWRIIGHRLTKASHPWSREDRGAARGAVPPRGGQVERTGRTTEEGEAPS
jgi:hypothetical protein